MGKNIVICCDGTGNQFGTRNTNIVKLCEVLDRSRQDQIVYYDPGVGTMGDQHALTRLRKVLTRMLGGAIGFGLTQNVQEAYDFLAWHYRPGDHVFLFGFSRGAYTARALAALIHMYGLTGPGTTNISPYLVGMLCDDEDTQQAGEDRGENRWHTANSFKKTYGTPVTIDFLGVFDTVDSVGWFWNPLTIPYSDRNPSVACARHAVSIDEHRAFFQPGPLVLAKGQDLKEVWFAGVHSDVGGGYKYRQQGLAQVAFAWMAREAASKGLWVDQARLDDALSGRKYAKADAVAAAHESLDWRWALLELMPQPRTMRYKDADGQRRWRWPVRINFFRRRVMTGQTVIHQSVVDRYNRDDRYRPANLGDPAAYAVET